MRSPGCGLSLKRTEISGGFRKTTNNRMEIFAAIAGLEMLKQPCKFTLYSDSQYVVKAMTEGWVAGWKKKSWWRTRIERPENMDLGQRLDALCQAQVEATKWIPSSTTSPSVVTSCRDCPVSAPGMVTPERIPRRLRVVCGWQSRRLCHLMLLAVRYNLPFSLESFLWCCAMRALNLARKRVALGPCLRP